MSKKCSTFAPDFENYTIMNAAAQQKAEYNVMYSSELPHYMSLDEMHERLIRDMQLRVKNEKCPQTISREELLARVEAADRRIDAGQFRAHAEAVRHFEQRMSERIAV